MKTERVKEGWEPLHEHEDGERKHRPDGEYNVDDNGPRVALAAETEPEYHLPQHLR